MKRGRPFGENKKEKDFVRKELARVSATAMEGAFGGCLTRMLAVKAELLWGNCILVMKKQTKNPTETTRNRYKIEISMSRTQKLKGLSAASLRLKTLNDNPYNIVNFSQIII